MSETTEAPVTTADAQDEQLTMQSQLYKGNTDEEAQAPAEETTEETTEEKPAEESTEETTEEKPAEESEKKAPDAYDFKIPKGMPEGFEKDEEVFGALADVARDLELTQDAAQKLVDQVWPVMHRRAEEQQIALNDQWTAEVKADKEIGGDKLDETLAAAKRAVKAYASEGMQQLLDGPLGSHPDVVRFLAKVGQTVSEDRFVGGEHRGPNEDPNDDTVMARKLYPKSQA